MAYPPTPAHSDPQSFPRSLWQMLADDPVNSLMRWPVAFVDDTDSLEGVSRALVESEIGAVLVLRNRTLVGVVSERGLTANLATGGESSDVTAADVMTADPVTVPPEAPILQAARLMAEARVRHLPVVSDGLVAGIVSMRDIFDVLLGYAQTRPMLARSTFRASFAVGGPR